MRCLEELYAQVFCYWDWVLLRKWHQNSYFFHSLPMCHQKPFQQRTVPWKMNVPHNQAQKKLWNQQIICEVSQWWCKVRQEFFISAISIEAGYYTALGKRAEAALTTTLPTVWPAQTSSCTITSQTHLCVPQSHTAPVDTTYQLKS